MTKNMILVALVITVIGAALWYYMSQSSNVPAPKAPDFAGLAPSETATGAA